MVKLLISSVVIIITSQSVMALLDKADLGEKLLQLAEILHNNCLHKSGTDEATIEQVRRGNFVEDVKIKKYVECLSLDTSVINDDGSFNMDMIAELSPPILKPEILRVTPVCDAETAGVTPLHEKTYAMMKCFYKKNPSKFFMV